MRRALLTGALASVTAYTTVRDPAVTPIKQHRLQLSEVGITPSWARASNAVPHWSNPVRYEPGFGIVSTALNRASEASQQETDGKGRHKSDNGHTQKPPKQDNKKKTLKEQLEDEFGQQEQEEQTEQKELEKLEHEQELELEKEKKAQEEKEEKQQKQQEEETFEAEEEDQQETAKKKVKKVKKVKEEKLAFDCATADDTLPGSTDDKWCSKNCNADPPYCPAELCTCKGGGPTNAVSSLPSPESAAAASAAVPVAPAVPDVPAVPEGQVPAPTALPGSTPNVLTPADCVGAECAGLGAGAGHEKKELLKCIALQAHCMPCGEPIPTIGGCNKNYDQSDCQADQCEWLGEFGPGCQMGESKEMAVGDDWCVESCNAVPPNCPEEDCECEGGNPMINNAGVERPPGMSKEANEIWTENEEKKQFSEREAVAKKEETKRAEIEEAKAKRDKAREKATEKAREEYEKRTADKAAAEQKERDDSVTERQTQAAERNEEAMNINKAASDEIAQTADDMKEQADAMKAAGDEMKKAAEKMQKQADDMKKQADEAIAAQTAMAPAGLPSPSPIVMPKVPGTDIPAAAPPVVTEQDMEDAFATAKKEHEAAEKALADAAKHNAKNPVPVRPEPDDVNEVPDATAETPQEPKWVNYEHFNSRAW